MPSNKLQVPLNADGSISWDDVRPSTAQKLLELLKTDKTIQDELGEMRSSSADTEDSSSAELFEGVTVENAGAFIDLINRVAIAGSTWAAGKFVKHPFLRTAQNKPAPMTIDADLLAKMQFTKEQHKELDPRAYRIAKKYQSEMPEWLKQHLDLYMFGMMFISYTAQNAKIVMEAQINRDVEKVKKARAAATPQNPQPTQDAKQPTNGVDKTPPPSFSGLTESEVAPPPPPPTDTPIV